MVALDLSEINEPFLHGRISRGEEVAPDAVHVRAPDASALVCHFDDDILRYLRHREAEIDRIIPTGFICYDLFSIGVVCVVSGVAIGSPAKFRIFVLTCHPEDGEALARYTCLPSCASGSLPEPYCSNEKCDKNTCGSSNSSSRRLKQNVSVDLPGTGKTLRYIQLAYLFFHAAAFFPELTSFPSPSAMTTRMGLLSISSSPWKSTVALIEFLISSSMM